MTGGWSRPVKSHSRAGSEFNTPRSENDTNFRRNAQRKAATRGGQRGALMLSVSVPYSQRIQPSLWQSFSQSFLAGGFGVGKLYGPDQAPVCL